MVTFQEILRRLSLFWEQQGCIIHQGYDIEVGAGTFNPATFLRCLGPEPYKAAYIEPSRRPTDGRYGENPNRTQHYFQYQVILKPSPENIQELYLQSLEAIGFNLRDHDIRFVHDDWEAPTLGAWGLGWEVWMDGMEVTQFTYFQCVGGIDLKPVTGEITYGLERLAMYLQKVDSFFDLKWNNELTYGDIYHRNEVEWSHYNFEKASTDMWFKHFEDFEAEAKHLMALNLPLPAYDFVMKASHAFNILDARGAISVTERTGYMARIRDLSCLIAGSYLKSREDLNFPLLQRFRSPTKSIKPAPDLIKHVEQIDISQTEDFLLEIGSEELPDTFVDIGQKNLEIAFKNLLQSEDITYRSLKTYGTPRRLSVYIQDIKMGKSAKYQEKRGPSIEQAFDQQGQVTPAGLGFFRSLGKVPLDLAQVKAGTDPHISFKKIKESDYLFAQIEIPGRTTASILAEKIPTLVLGLDFPKKMRWADLDITYPRPLRWIVALLGNQVIPFEIGTIQSGRVSYGHRQLRPYDFSLLKAQDYIHILNEHRVMVDPIERKRAISTQLDGLEKTLNVKVICREKVIGQVVNLVEWPQVAAAHFNPSFLKVPQEVLISEMVEHQKYFPVTDHKGQLVNYFVITADTNVTEQIKEGNQKVLSARLSDGTFLYEQGLKYKLEHYNQKLKHVTFLKDLGSVYDKMLRIQQHAKCIQNTLKIAEPSKVERAAYLCKADLASEMVFEFPSLQGVIGRYYALAEGEDQEVATAIDEHWMPRGENAPLPETATGIIISLADKIDNLIACFGMGLKPTSSSDAYALRRQVLGIIKMIIKGHYRFSMQKLLEACLRHFPSSITKQAGLVEEIKGFMFNRVKTVFLDYGFNKDEIEAALSHGFDDIYDAFCKVSSLHQFRTRGEKFHSLYEVYKRAKGQLTHQHSVAFSSQLLKENAEKELDQVLTGNQQAFDQAIHLGQYDKAYDLIAQIQLPLASLFNEVKILADDPEIRNNRIALLQRVFALFNQLLDFSKIAEK